MNLRTYHGATMAEALANVKRDLGRDAVILQTRTIRKGGVLGVGRREVVEVTASGDMNVLPRTVRAGVPAERDGLARLFGAAGNSPAVAPAAVEPPDTRRLREELTAIRTMVSDLVRQSRLAPPGQWQGPELPQELFNAYLHLLESEVAEELARQIVQSLRGQLTGQQAADRRAIHDALVQCIGRMIPTAGPIRLDGTGPARLVALVGPTGVGKTTTLAKLAAHYRLREGRRVGLATVDTYRIAAVNQLATYAQIIDVPLKVALTPDELRQAADELRASCDLVLLDTAGRCPTDGVKLGELGAFLAAARPDEVHLVLSSTAHRSALRLAVQRFRPLGVNRVILTKLDEAVSFGLVLEVIRQVDASLSYVTTGQDVPDDIEIALGDRLAQWIINRSLADPPAGQLDMSVADSPPGRRGADHA